MVKHKKASDIFNESTYLFAPKTTFEKAFPEIEEVLIEVDEGGYDESKHHKTTYQSPDLPGEFVDCTNTRCYRGGFSVGLMLREMIRDRLTELEKGAMCRGYEGSPKGRVRRQDCHHTFDVKVRIKYKQNPADSLTNEANEKA